MWFVITYYTKRVKFDHYKYIIHGCGFSRNVFHVLQLDKFRPFPHRLFRLNNISKVLNFLEDINVSPYVFFNALFIYVHMYVFIYFSYLLI